MHEAFVINSAQSYKNKFIIVNAKTFSTLTIIDFTHNILHIFHYIIQIKQNQSQKSKCCQNICHKKLNRILYDKAVVLFSIICYNNIGRHLCFVYIITNK